MLGLVVASCSPAPVPGEKLEVVPVATEQTSEVYSTSASFKLNTKGISQIAYKVVKGELVVEPDLPVLYSSAIEEGSFVETVDGENNLTVYGLEGNTEYTIYFVYAKGDEFVLLSQKFTTPEYNQMITIIDRTANSITVHFELPKDKYFRWVMNKRDDYLAMKKMYMYSDYDFLMQGFMITGSQTMKLTTGDELTFFGGDPNSPYDQYPVEIFPGYPLVFMLAQCDEEGEVYAKENPEFNYGGGGGGIMPLTKAPAPMNVASDYTEVHDATDAAMIIDSLYARQYSFGGFTKVESKVEAKVIKDSPRKVTLSCNSDEDVNYTAAVFTAEEYRNNIYYCDERGIAPAILYQSFGNEYSGATELSSNSDIHKFEVGDTCYFVIASRYDDEYTILGSETISVIIPEPTAPKADIVITPMTAPEGYSGANTVWFNIKSPSKNVEYIEYLMNYSKEWMGMEKMYSVEEMLDRYGLKIDDKSIIDQINSDAGYNQWFSSYENTESKLAIYAYNSDDIPTLCTAVNSTTEIPAKPRVESPLFQSLLGDWTASAKFWYSEYDETTFTSRDVEYSGKSKVTISAGPTEAPDTFGPGSDGYEGVYTYFLNAAKNQGFTDDQAAVYAQIKVADLYDEYVEYQQMYTNKYRGQNRLVCLGFDFAHEYYSSWDLFVDPTFSVIDTDQLFYCYGPKFFIELEADGKWYLVCDPEVINIAPISAVYDGDCVFVGYNANAQGPVKIDKFPIEMAADGNSFTIKPVVIDGVEYRPSPAVNNMQFYIYLSRISSDIVFTKGYTPETSTSATSSMTVDTDTLNKIIEKGKGKQRMVRTRLPMTKDGMLPRPNVYEL